MNQGVAPGRAPGSYLLRFALETPVTLDVGSLGTLHLAAGILYYAGSAFGPGGVAARVARHVSGVGRLHWHVDRLRAVAPVREVWFSHAAERLEHAWVAALLTLPGARLAAARFGASDCRCAGHLVHLARPPDRAVIVAALGGGRVRRWVPGD